MEESEPINSPHIEHEQVAADARKEKESLYHQPGESAYQKPLCFLGNCSKKYRNFFTVLIFFLLAFIFFEQYLNNYILKARDDNFNHNLSLLKEYQKWSKQSQQPKTNNEAKTPQKKVTQDSQQAVLSIPQQAPTNIVEITRKPSIQDTFQSGQIEPLTQLIQEQPQTTANNPFTFTDTFDFSSQKNFQLDSQNDQLNQPIKKIDEVQIIQTENQKKELTFSPIQFDKSNNDAIDYENYIGINVDQVANALNWMQLKSFKLEETNPNAHAQRKYYEQKYKIGSYGEIPICVVVPSFNNAIYNRHISNMNSILMQEYTNYHIVFIDDASTDSTANDILQLLTKQKKLSPKQFVVIRNQKQMKAMYNLRMAASLYCKPQEIFIVVDGDDELIGRQVFKLFNANFQLSGAWFVYSNFLTANNYVGFSRIIPPKVVAKNGYRKYPFVTSHLRAFYTQLFRNIKEEDLRDQKGQYLAAANDVAICLPILQQAQDRVFYIPQVTYYYNSQTGLNNHLLRFKEQKENEIKMRSKKTYARLQELFG